jgi:hypothetical protein
MIKKISPPGRGDIENTQGNANKNLKPTKQRAMLERFASGERFHRFEAERVGDHCLPSTVSEIETKYQISFSREWVAVRNRFGTSTRVVRYGLENESLAKARAIVSGEVLP